MSGRSLSPSFSARSEIRRGGGRRAKPVEKMASLLFTIMDAGQGGSITLSDKSKPKPDWFNADAGWNTYTQPVMATLEENTDVIVGIFKHYGLDPKKHNIFPVEEETEQNAATEAAEENVEEYLQNQIVEEISLEAEFEGPNDEIDDEAFSESVDEALQQIVNERLEHELETIWQEQLEIVSTDLTPEPQLEPQDPVVQEPDNNEKDESASRLKKGFNLFQVPQKSDEKRNERTKKAKLREEKDEKTNIPKSSKS